MKKSIVLVFVALALMSCGSPVDNVAQTPASGTSESLALVAGSQVGLTPAGTSQPAVATGWTRYEAEDTAVATAVGTASIEEQGFESGGKAIGQFATAPAFANFSWSTGGAVKFTLTGLAAGTYTVRLGFNGNDDKTILASRDNGATTVQLSLPAVAGTDNAWNLAQTVDLSVVFTAGDNSLWISQPVQLKAGDPTPWINIDYIDIKKQ